MKSVLTQSITIDEVIEKIEAKLNEVDLIEGAMVLTQQELAVVKSRIEISWQMIKLRVVELRTLLAELKPFISHGPNGESEG